MYFTLTHLHAHTYTYMQLCEVLQEKNRALVVLDTSYALMYLLPPVPDAGQLLDPPTGTPANLLGTYVALCVCVCVCVCVSKAGICRLRAFRHHYIMLYYPTQGIIMHTYIYTYVILHDVVWLQVCWP
jgi:hypothetical protein